MLIVYQINLIYNIYIELDCVNPIFISDWIVSTVNILNWRIQYTINIQWRIVFEIEPSFSIWYTLYILDSIIRYIIHIYQIVNIYHYNSVYILLSILISSYPFLSFYQRHLCHLKNCEGAGWNYGGAGRSVNERSSSTIDWAFVYHSDRTREPDQHNRTQTFLFIYLFLNYNCI